MIQELERLVRRVRILPLVLPVLLVSGWALGRTAAGALGLPEDAAPRATSGPRVHLESLGRFMAELRIDGERTEEYVIMYRDHVAPVEEALLRRGVAEAVARQAAWPLVEHSYRRGLDPAIVAAVMLLESSGRPDATSPVGARGLMQVMPFWTGRWLGCGTDLYDIHDNICHGTRILAHYLENAGGDERRALLGYNGCVRGSNTPGCFGYPDRVQALRGEIRREWEMVGGVAPAAAAP